MPRPNDDQKERERGELSGDHARDPHPGGLGDNYARDTHRGNLGDDYARDARPTPRPKRARSKRRSP